MVDLTGNWDTRISRRTLLRTGGAAAVVLYGSAVPSASAGPKFADYPFKLGVASGEPTPDGIVLWTRLAPDPLNGGGLGTESYRVRFEVAADPRFRRIVHRAHTRVGPEEVHTVHADVTGLRPERDYWYRFESKREVSPVGHFRTAPRRANHLKFAFVSCQNYTHGFFPAFEDLVEQDLELVVHLGDYIYEGPGLASGVRTHAPVASLMTLEDYRTRHAQYKTDAALQAAHAAFPWLMTWDDHEFWNNYADLDLDPNQPLETVEQRRAAAYLAYWEHSPLPRSRKPVGQDMPMYRRASWSDLVLFHVLDTRQHRSDQVSCPPAQRLPNGYCPAALDPARAILGEEQRTWQGAPAGEPDRHHRRRARPLRAQRAARLRELRRPAGGHRVHRHVDQLAGQRVAGGEDDVRRRRQQSAPAVPDQPARLRARRDRPGALEGRASDRGRAAGARRKLDDRDLRRRGREGRGGPGEHLTWPRRSTTTPPAACAGPRSTTAATGTATSSSPPATRPGAVVLQVRTDTFGGLARPAHAEERTRLWELMVGAFPRYEAYEREPGRPLPIVVVTPTPSG